ncbi:PTPLA-domain-containing protein [Suhomyces tanzawaensis NRRL Y-17324]|uniref:Very-long-chain (3R)-3-hydroxyacyl-CoA dehydratase n=1 Tax=Suhomyces tanzawaensis NRRL Y-17324 TaxID=984487 RepID=A0A1E4SMJ4_9ASCO|nr:PTPLA-domain-containing protein [Suhomyces tanzawaensis NRRL Y-17324]ODV80602.1 PTPLA-domain-containing protein [Suhomyces tanzawaensis NRRL Y-17324]
MSAPAQAHPKKWLIAYNSISASLWSIVFFNTVFVGAFLGQPSLFDLTGKITIAVQCLAVTEIYNSAAGVVKTPLFTTVAQVLSRLAVVIGVFLVLPNSPANYHWVYITVCLSWSITEIIRYSFYAISLRGEGVPQWLTWLRYSTFLVLYVTGISSEVAIFVLSLDEAATAVGKWYSWLFIAILAIYVPGSYILYTYMIKQRRKVLYGKSKKTQ